MIDVVTLSRTPEYFERAARSLAAQNVGFVGWAVDNTPDGSLGPVARRYGWNVIPFPNDLTFSKGNNFAVALGREERILLLNDDATLGAGAMRAMMSHSEDVVGCLLLNDDGTVNHAGTAWNPMEGFVHIGRGSDPMQWMGSDEVTPAATFAVALVNRSMWDKLGGLAEQYSWGFEDTDYCMAVWEAGGRVLTCRAAVGEHSELGTRTGETDGGNGFLFRSKWMHTHRMFRALPGLKQPSTKHESV
jgi:GT2 family glycosyltransferase